MPKAFFIINSRIGTDRLQAVEAAVRQYFSAADTTVRRTEYGGHASVLAREALEHADTLVIAVGGDGTVNEVVQVMAHTGRPMAIVPTGSGNGLARHCGIPIELEKAVQLAAEGRTEPIDLGMANEKYFISNAGVGFDAVVCNSIRETKSRGLKMYIAKVIQHYFTYRRDTYNITADDRSISMKAFFLNVANGREFGYGFQISPGASLQDGLLDVIITKKIHALNGLLFVIDGWRKRLHKNRNCIHFTTRTLRVEGQNLRYFQTDGDAHACNGICEISVWPRALQLIVPNTISKL